MNNTVGFLQRLELGRSFGVAALDSQGIITSAQLPKHFENPQAEADEDIRIGQPLYLTPNGHLGLATSIDVMRSHAIGLALSDASVGHACSYTNFGNVLIDVGSAITGDILLKVGQIYYLSAITGQITNIPPESGYLVEIGRAVNNNAITLNISQSILL